MPNHNRYHESQWVYIECSEKHKHYRKLYPKVKQCGQKRPPKNLGRISYRFEYNFTHCCNPFPIDKLMITLFIFYAIFDDALSLIFVFKPPKRGMLLIVVYLFFMNNELTLLVISNSLILLGELLLSTFPTQLYCGQRFLHLAFCADFQLFAANSNIADKRYKPL